MESNDNNKREYISFKKVLLFGDKSSGKSSFSNILKTGEFPNNISPTKNG